MSRIELPPGISSLVHALLDHTGLPGVLSSVQIASQQLTNQFTLSVNPGFTPVFGMMFHQTNYAFIELMGSAGIFFGTGTTQNFSLYSGGLSNAATPGVCAQSRNSTWRCDSFTSSLVRCERVSGGDVFGTGLMVVVGY